MPTIKPKISIQTKFIVALLTLFIISCGTINPFKQSQEELDTKIKVFNLEFESRSLDRSSRFVHPNHLEEFQTKSIDFVKKVTIFKATRLDLILLKDDKPIKITPSLFETDFNKAKLMVRYQLSILPSTKLKTIIVKQEWVKFNGSWFVILNLDSFLN